MDVRRPLEAKKETTKFDPKIAYPPPTRPLCDEEVDLDIHLHDIVSNIRFKD